MGLHRLFLALAAIFTLTFAWKYFLPGALHFLALTVAILIILARKIPFLKSCLSYRDMQLALVIGVLAGLLFLIISDLKGNTDAEAIQLDRITHISGGYFIVGTVAIFGSLHNWRKRSQIFITLAVILTIAVANEWVDKLQGRGWNNGDFLAFLLGWIVQSLRLI